MEKSVTVFMNIGKFHPKPAEHMDGIRMTHKLLLLLAVLPVLFTSPVLAKEFKDSSGATHLTMQMEKKPLSEIAEEVFKQTGYRVVFDEKWNSLTVTGSYSDVSIDEFFRRAFRKQNTSLLVNDKEKIVAVRFFGDKSFADLLASVSPGKVEAEIPEDIARLHMEQRAELQEYLRDPESVDPLSGMKLVDIRAMHEEQHAELEQMKQNPETIDPTSGAALGELQQLHAAQQQENDQLRNNSETTEPESGMTIGSIAELHRQQREELERMLHDPNTIDPTSGMKLSEIWEQGKKAE
ncbi:MAG: hypothetical protein ACYC9M_13815 [Desulfobulbaceae bacterium]